MFIIRYIQAVVLLTLLMNHSIGYAADVAIPNIVGLTIQEAKKNLANEHLLSHSIQYQVTSNYLENTIIVQAPPAGTYVDPNFNIQLIVAKSPQQAKYALVPNLKGMSLDEARAALAKVNLRLGYIRKRSIKMDKRQVLYQTPKAFGEILEQHVVNVTVSEAVNAKVPRIKTIIDKTHFDLGESTQIRAKLYNVDLKRKIEYGFSINGRTHYSFSPSYRYTFKRQGVYKITVSFRYVRGTWYASHTKKATVYLKALPSRDNASKRVEAPPATERRHIASIEDSKPKKPAVTTPPKEEPPKKAKATKPVTKAVTPKEKPPKTAPKRESHRYVPNVVGLSQPAARRLLKEIDFQITIVKKPHQKSNNVVLEQSPKANKRLKKGTKITLTIAVGTKKAKWVKPKAIIEPTHLEVIQGKKARFFSQSIVDQASQLSYNWSSKFGHESTAKRFKINTKYLKTGKYWIRLKIVDDKKLSDRASAVLVIKENPALIKKKVQKDKEIIIPIKAEPILSKAELNSALYKEIKQFQQLKPKSNGEYVESLLQEAKQPDNIGKLRNFPKQTPIPFPLHTYNSENLYIAYLNALLIEVRNTIDLSEDVLLSETLMQSSETSNKLNLSKVSYLEDIFSSWHIWIWLILLVVICAALVYILWIYRKSKRVNTLNIVYQHQNDLGKQHIFRKR